MQVSVLTTGLLLASVLVSPATTGPAAADLEAEALQASAEAGELICDAGGPYVAECSNGLAMAQLDGSGSSGPAGVPLKYFWFIECGSATISDPTVVNPIITLDMTGYCNAQCGRVDLFVTAGDATRSCTTMVSFTDSIPPVIQCPDDISVAPGASTEPSNTGFATATDGCRTPTVTWHDDLSTPGVIVRTWVADDGCNESACVQVITVEEPPPLEQLVPTGYECEAFINGTAPNLVMTVNSAGNIAPGRFFYYNWITASGDTTAIVRTYSDPAGATQMPARAGKVFIIEGPGLCKNVSNQPGVSITFANNEATFFVPEAIAAQSIGGAVILRTEYSSVKATGQAGTTYYFETEVNGVPTFASSIVVQ